MIFFIFVASQALDCARERFQPNRQPCKGGDETQPPTA
jgi:hypothetical protein